MAIQKATMMSRVRGWLAFRLLRHGITIEVEVRHGAHRARHKQLWKGGLVRAEIPVSRPSHPSTQACINRFTGERAGTARACDTCNGKGFVE